MRKERMPLSGNARPALGLLFAFCTLSLAAASEDCKDLGFTGTQLCGDCDKLEEYVNDEGLAQECRSCCVGESDGASIQLFDRAVLEVCKHRMREFPQVEGFIKRRADDYGSLKVSYKFGKYPKLIFKGTGKQKEEIRIDSWTTDNIAEYLDSKLTKSSQES